MEGVDLSGIEVWYLRELARIYMLLKFRLNSYFSRPPQVLDKDIDWINNARKEVTSQAQNMLSQGMVTQVRSLCTKYF